MACLTVIPDEIKTAKSPENEQYFVRDAFGQALTNPTTPFHL
jgi:hypothetical protein